VPEEAAEVVPILGLRRVPPLRGGEGEEHRPAVHGAVRRVEPDAPDGLLVTTRVLTPSERFFMAAVPILQPCFIESDLCVPPVISKATPGREENNARVVSVV